MDCIDFVMEPGDVLYLPRGVIHFATTGSRETSAHLTISMDALHRTWKDMFVSACSFLGHTLCSALDAAIEHSIVEFDDVVWLQLASSPTGRRTDDVNSMCSYLSSLGQSLLRSFSALPKYMYWLTNYDFQRLIAQLSACDSEFAVVAEQHDITSVRTYLNSGKTQV